MKTKTFIYKEYIGSIETDLESLVLFGKLLFIDDVITFEAATLPELKVEFEAAVEDYLDTCATIGRDPQKTYKGSFNIRIGEDLHREAAKASYGANERLNEFCKTAIEQRVQNIKDSEISTPPEVQVHILRPREEPSRSNIIYPTVFNVTEEDSSSTAAQKYN